MLINSPNISGSLKVTGNAVITGSLAVLGGINATIEGTAATASYVQYTSVANKPTLVSGSSQISFTGITSKPTLVSGSGQISFTGITNKPTLVSGSSQVSFTGITNKPTLVSGSSQISYSGISGKPSGIVSSSVQVRGYNLFATTGSNQFNGSQAITGSLTVTGQVVAQTLNVQQVTSSIVFSSGSNIFGNSLSNTQQFTGSLQVSGSSHNILGNVGIGPTGTPSAELQVGKSSDVTIAMSNSSSLTSGNRGSLAWYNSAVSTVAIIRAAAVTDNVGTELQFYTRPAAGSVTQAMTLGTNSGLSIGTTSAAPSQGLLVQGAANFNSSVTAAGYITGQGTNPGGLGGSRYVLDWFNGMRVFSYGANSSTNGGFLFNSQRSDGTNSINYLDIASTGAATFSSSVTAGGTITNQTSGGDAILYAKNGTVTAILVANTTGELMGIGGTESNHPYIIRTGNTERMRITSGGNVGIGTTSPSAKLQVQGSTNITGDLFVGTAQTYGYIYGPSSQIFGSIGANTTWINAGTSGLRFNNAADNTTLMFINNAGNVGIGTSSPSSKLHVQGTSYFFDESYFNDKIGIGTTSLSAPLSFGKSVYGAPSSEDFFRIKFEDLGGIHNDVGIGQPDPGCLGFNAAAAGYISFNEGTNGERVRIAAGGNVGIGTTSPSQLLEIKGTAPFYSVYNMSGEGGIKFRNDGGTTMWNFVHNNSDGNFYFKEAVNSLVPLTLTYATGRVGIGTTSPANTLHVAGVGRIDTGLYFVNGGTGGAFVWNIANESLRFGTNDTERMRITSDGNLLVGSTNADVGGSVKGAIIRQNGSIVGATNISSPFHYQSPIAADRMNTQGDGLMYGMWRQGIFQAGIGATNASVMTFFTGNNDSMSERMRITSDGTVQPGANGTQDLGTSSLRWATVFTSDLSLSNGIGDYTIVEGENDLFLYNNKQNKVYKFVIEEVDPSTATPKKS